MGCLLGIDPFTVCAIVGTDNAVGAQTERRGEAGPVSALLAAVAHKPLELLLNPSFHSRANRESPEDIIIASGGSVARDVCRYIQAHIPSGGEIGTATLAQTDAAARGRIRRHRAAGDGQCRGAIVVQAAAEAVASVGSRTAGAADGLIAAKRAARHGELRTETPKYEFERIGVHSVRRDLAREPGRHGRERSPQRR